MEPKEIVASGWDRVAHQYAQLESPDRPWPRGEWLADLLARLPLGSAVLDLGCGAGAPAGVEIARSHHLTGVDISPVQVALARANVPGATFLVGDATSLVLEPGSFEAVVSFYSFDHIPADQHPGLLTRIFDWLRPGGYLLLSIEDSDQPGVVVQWLGVDMFFSTRPAEGMRRLIEEKRFEVFRCEVEGQFEGETEIPYTWILARRPSTET